MRVLIPQGIADEGMQWLDERGYEIKIRSGTSIEASKTDVVDCSAILARTEPIPAEVLEAGECLRVVARHGVGCDNVDVKRAEELGIWVANAPESNANSVAEHAVLLMAALARSLPRIDAALRSGDFQIRDRELGVELAEKTVGVVGLGRIGLLVARKAALGLDMKVLAYDPFVKKMPNHVQRTADWEEVWDFVDGCMRSYLILKEKTALLDEDQELGDLLADLASPGEPLPTSDVLKRKRFDLAKLAARKLHHERIDQIVQELLMGVR